MPSFLKIFFAFCVIFFCVACHTEFDPDKTAVFTQKSSLPIGRASASSFVYEQEAFVLCGRDSDGRLLHDFWQYNANFNEWRALPDLPFKARVKAVAEVVDGYAYVGLGFNGKVYVDTAYLRDWWRYDISTASWMRCADFPSINSDVCVSFVNETDIYVMFGFYNGFTGDVYKYATTTDTWSHCTTANAYERAGAVGCTNGERFFAGTGYNTTNMNDWWEFYPETEQWIRRADLIGRGRVFASAVAVEQRMFVIGGRYFGGSLTTGLLYNDLLEYDVVLDAWSLKGYLPGGGRENMITFSINGQGYFGLGEDSNGFILNDLYCWSD